MRKAAALSCRVHKRLVMVFFYMTFALDLANCHSSLAVRQWHTFADGPGAQPDVMTLYMTVSPKMQGAWRHWITSTGDWAISAWQPGR